MELYKQSVKLFWKRKILWIPLVAYNLWNMTRIYWYVREELDIELLSHTGDILLLCPQILVLYLILSYEFFSERYRTGLEESTRTTAMGFGSKPAIAQAAAKGYVTATRTHTATARLFLVGQHVKYSKKMSGKGKVSANTGWGYSVCALVPNGYGSAIYYSF